MLGHGMLQYLQYFRRLLLGTARPGMSWRRLSACSVETRLDELMRERPSAETSLGTADTSVRATIASGCSVKDYSYRRGLET